MQGKLLTLLKNAKKTCIWKCRLFMSSAEYSCKSFKPIFAYWQTVWTLFRLLLRSSLIWVHTVCKNDFLNHKQMTKQTTIVVIGSLRVHNVVSFCLFLVKNIVLNTHLLYLDIQSMCEVYFFHSFIKSLRLSMHPAITWNCCGVVSITAGWIQVSKHCSATTSYQRSRTQTKRVC